ncbi:MAG: site-2 protease family protein [Candidatus Pacebacteria bacterium]|nr:site-2 protease family protein [Candidatus Paceibacterota bacterium]
MLGLLFSSPLAFFLILIGLLLSISLHEAAHCYVTDGLGDPTPRLKGRLTLDPRAHLDPLGTILIILTGFGWGKAAPYDPYNLKSPVRDTAIIALAGPLTNLLIAVILSVLSRMFASDFFSLFARVLIQINLSLALFNLLPVYPLDGGKIMRAILPRESSLEYEAIMERYGQFILLFLILPIFNGQSAVVQLLSPIINLLSSWLI